MHGRTFIPCLTYRDMARKSKSRAVGAAKSKGMLVDATCGRKCKAVLVTEDDHIVLSAISAEAIHNRTVESEEQKDEQ